MGFVKIWRERITIPTYKPGQPDKNPMFLEKRVYQGSSGAVYPHPVIESISDVKEDCLYDAVFLENLYLKIMILLILEMLLKLLLNLMKKQSIN